MEELKPMAPLESLACYCWDKHLEHGLEAYHGSKFDEGADHAYLEFEEQKPSKSLVLQDECSSK